MKNTTNISIIAILTCISLVQLGNTCRGRTVYRSNGMSYGEKQLILDLHNKMRQNVALGQIFNQPPAANLQEMQWDDELAFKAQQWAVTCSPTKHDQYRHIDRFSVGQNVAKTWTTAPPSNSYSVDPDFSDIIINKWFGEFKNFRYGPLQFVDDYIGHYTQMIWSETYLVGCGYAFYYQPELGFVKNYVCNYGPSGNILQRQPYVPGKPSCYSFGMTNSQKYYGLCDTRSRFIETVKGNYLDFY